MERVWLKSYPEGVAAEIDPERFRSLDAFFADSVAKFRSRTAFISMGRAMSFDELDRRSRDFASYLKNVAGLQRGARVALMMPNLLQYPIALIGVLRAGLVAVNCNPLYSPRELGHQLADSGAEAIVVLENFAHVLEKAAERAPVARVVVTGVGDQLGAFRGALVNLMLRRVKRAAPKFDLPGAVRFNTALALGARQSFAPPKIEPNDPAFLQYTGGTTGVPKGAMLTHRNLIGNLMQVHAWLERDLAPGEEVFVTALPLYHVFALTANCFTPIMLGAANLLIANPRDPSAFAKALRDTPFTILTGVNTLFAMMLEDPAFASVDFSHTKAALAGGMALQRVVAERWKARTGKPIIEAFGLTETSPAATINRLDIDDYTGSIGLPLPSTEVVVRDIDGRDLGIGEVGELCIRGPQVMAGYWGKAEETAAVLGADGFLSTGDLARIDEKGYVYIVDRKKDMIIVSGFNVYPNEVEDVVMRHPGVAEVGAVGVPDAKSGEAVKIVVRRKDPELTSEALIAHCRRHLTAYKTPKHVEFRETLPRSPIGKILRRELKGAKPDAA